MEEEDAITNKVQVHSWRGAGHCAAPEEWKRICTEAFWCCCQAMLLLALAQAEANDAQKLADEAAADEAEAADWRQLVEKFTPGFVPAGTEVRVPNLAAEAAPAAEEELSDPVSSHQRVACGAC